jgi:endonuclease YncB( thermonuclease family)
MSRLHIRRCAVSVLGVVLAIVGLLAPAVAADIAGTAIVIEGDTLEVSATWVRLYGIDTPERSEPGGAEATRALLSIVSRGDVVFALRTRLHRPTGVGA